MSQSPWWKGTRGEWYVVTQIGLIALVIFGPRTWMGWPNWTFPFTLIGSIAGGVLILTGIFLLLAAMLRLGTNLTAVPYPKENGTLVETGPYRIVRHPIYCGGIFICFGYALFVPGWLTIGYAIILLIFFDVKSRMEENWLKEKFAGYDAYQKRVRKLIPFIY